MKNKLKNRISLIVICTSLLVLAVSCKKEDDDIPKTVTDIDGNVYNTVIIGTQVWLKENLKTTKYNDGEAIPLVTVGAEWNTLTTPGFCWYNNDKATFGNTHGALYNWFAVATDKLCPTGWHVPSDDEWTILTDLFGGESVAGGALKEKGTLHWDNPNEGATDEVGFSAIGSGCRQYSDGGFYFIGRIGFYWSATSFSATNAWFRSMYHDDAGLSRTKDWENKNAFSVRCIMD